MSSLYHEYGGVAGYRTIKVYLEQKNIYLSRLTVHKYMNRELELTSVVRRKKPGYHKGKAHKVFENLVHQEFSASEMNQKWCTDFTYLFLTYGSKRFNCSTIDLHDRSVITSITDKNITADLAIRTVTKALGSQYTSKDFVEFCESAGITQSMSKAGYSYDNAPMERYYNTLKNEPINLHPP